MNLIKRNIGIDLFRSLSMLYIIGYWHLFNYTDSFPYYNNFITDIITRTLLSLLVLISGYYASSSSLSIKDFYQKKVIRIYPLYLLALFIYIVFGFCNLKMGVVAAFSLSMFFEPAPYTLWFVSMIVVFYLLTPIFISILEKNVKTFYISVSLMILFLLLYEIITGLLDIRFLMYLPAYLVGMMMKQNKLPKIEHSLFLLIFTSIILLLLFYVESKNISSLIKIPFITYAAFLLFQKATSVNIKNEFLVNIILKLSFSTWCMYLFHRPVYAMLLKLYKPEGLINQILYLLLIGVPIIIFIAYVIQYVYNKGYTKLSSKILIQ
jgi:peptidoglycan/LPS O-acetylase OafA/YrhL